MSQQASHRWGLVEGIVIILFLAVVVVLVAPALLQPFVRRGKVDHASLNTKAIANGAMAWFDDEHADPKGDPLPKHFPNPKSPTHATNGRVIVVTPKERPCFSGKAMYPKRPELWNKEPWRSLRFQIDRAHHYQYTYITSGQGTKAVATIRAHADMDCDGILSTYEVKLKYNPATKEMERTVLFVDKALE